MILVSRKPPAKNSLPEFLNKEDPPFCTLLGEVHIDADISGQENLQLPINTKNWAFTGGSDYVVASAKKLYDEVIEVVDKKTLLIPNRVDTRHYRHPKHNDVTHPINIFTLERDLSILSIIFIGLSHGHVTIR